MQLNTNIVTKTTSEMYKHFTDHEKIDFFNSLSKAYTKIDAIVKEGMLLKPKFEKKEDYKNESEYLMDMLAIQSVQIICQKIASALYNPVK